MDSFNPTVRCPHCGGVNRPSVTGWGREGLNSRAHQCKHCSEEYVVVVYVMTSTDQKISDRHIGGIKLRIESRQKQLRELESRLANKAGALAEEYIRVQASRKGRQN